MNMKWGSFVRALGLAVLLCVVGVPASAAPPPLKPVFVYMVDVTNSMVGCPRCFYGKKTDNVMPEVLARIAEEVKAAPKPLEVLVVPFARGIADFDGEGPFDPWRVFYHQQRRGRRGARRVPGPRGVRAGGRRRQDGWAATPAEIRSAGEEAKTWPGFAKACEERDYFTSALYDAIIAGFEQLRRRVPNDRDARLAYLSEHLHRLTVFSDSENGVKTAIFPHILQGAELHRQEMDGRFWLTRVYAEGKTPDNGVDEELRTERRIAATEPGIVIVKLKDMPPVADMLTLNTYRLTVEQSVDDPERLAEGVLALDLPEFSAAGTAESLLIEARPSALAAWPAGTGVTGEDAVVPAPFDDLRVLFKPAAVGIKKLLTSEAGAETFRVQLTATGKKGGAGPLFLLSGAPELSIFMDVTVLPPTGTITAAFTAPGQGAAESEGVWVVPPIPMRKIRSGGLTPGTLVLTGDAYALDPELKIRFDEGALAIDGPEGVPLADGATVGLGTFKVAVKTPAEPGTVNAELSFETLKAHLRFAGGERAYAAKFRVDVQSDAPFYALIAAIVAAVLGAAGAVTYKIAFSPRKYRAWAASSCWCVRRKGKRKWSAICPRTKAPRLRSAPRRVATGPSPVPSSRISPSSSNADAKRAACASTRPTPKSKTFSSTGTIWSRTSSRTTTGSRSSSTSSYTAVRPCSGRPKTEKYAVRRGRGK
ncbi:MAG: hypothetical protein M5R36_06980 [Deltaproteobacteria bacterium]|nr:hypothetical protein [Deltaproteobacteria bacterium]